MGEVWIIQADHRVAMSDTEAHECASWLASQHGHPSLVVLDAGAGLDSLEAVVASWHAPCLRVRKRDAVYPGQTTRAIAGAIERAEAGVPRFLYFAKQGARLFDMTTDPERVLDSAKQQSGALFFLP